MKRASEQALSVPTFRTSMDCTPWVLGGLWPTELQEVTSETALLAEYLKNDLQRIADSANGRLRAIAAAGLEEPQRQAEESRVINVARAFAVLRVESTVRLLRKEAIGFHQELLSLTGPQGRPHHHPVDGNRTSTGRHHATDRNDERVEQVAAVRAPETPPETAPPHPVDAVDEHRAVADADPVIAEPEHVVAAAPIADTPPDVAESVVVTPEPIVPEVPRYEPVCIQHTARLRPEVTDVPSGPPVVESLAEDEELRLQRLVRFVARQEPGLRWAVGRKADGRTLLVTDLAHGWIPPGINLPEGVELLRPERRSGNAAAMLGPAEQMATYAPGNSFGPFSDRGRTVVSQEPRRLEEVADLDQWLSDVTRNREGLPRLTHTLAAAAAGGHRVNDAEVDVLRVHLDTARYQLMAQYPDVDNGLLLNCLLLAATEALVTGDRVVANYQCAWFQTLSGPLSARWRANA